MGRFIAIQAFSVEPKPFHHVFFNAVKLYLGVWPHALMVLGILVCLDWLIFSLVGAWAVYFNQTWVHQLLGALRVFWQLSSFAFLSFAWMTYALKPNAVLASVLKEGLMHLPRFYMAWLVGCLWVILGFMLILPGLYLMLALPLVVPLILFCDTTPWGAMRRAYQILRKNWWHASSVLVMTLMITVLFLTLLGASGWGVQSYGLFTKLVVLYGIKWLLIMPMMVSIVLMLTHQLLLIETEREAAMLDVPSE